MNLNFNDFQKQDIKFDILKLRKAYNDILKIIDNLKNQKFSEKKLNSIIDEINLLALQKEFIFIN